MILIAIENIKYTAPFASTAWCYSLALGISSFDYK